MADVSADEMVKRLRRSLAKLLGWAVQYKPTMLRERAKFDADLDEAEDLLDATKEWTVLNANQWLRIVPKKTPKGQ